MNPDMNGWRRRLVERASEMAKSGRLSDEEAERLRLADQPGEVDEVIRSIRVRHAGARLGAAVEDGSVTREEADGLLDRLKNGEHSAAIRAQVRKLRPRSHIPARPRRNDPPEDTLST